jgi:hypothetical protein
LIAWRLKESVQCISAAVRAADSALRPPTAEFPASPNRLRLKKPSFVFARRLEDDSAFGID